MKDHSCTRDRAGHGWVHAWTGSEGTGRYGPFAHATSRSYQYLKIKGFPKRSKLKIFLIYSVMIAKVKLKKIPTFNILEIGHFNRNPLIHIKWFIKYNGKYSIVLGLKWPLHIVMSACLYDLRRQSQRLSLFSVLIFFLLLFLHAEAYLLTRSTLTTCVSYILPHSINFETCMAKKTCIKKVEFTIFNGRQAW